MEEQELKQQICQICHNMWQLGWVAANDGNVTAKLEDGNFLATPTGISKSFITPEKLLKINSRGEVLEGLPGYRPSSELKMHLRCYAEREDIGAVVHAHPPTATGFAVAHLAMDRYTMIESVPLSAGSRCFAVGEPRRPDHRGRCAYRLLPDGNIGIMGQN